MIQTPKPGLYRHYKGGLYRVLGAGRHSETEAWLVIYRAEPSGDLWVRPLGMWNESVGGEPRFAPVPQASAHSPARRNPN